MNHFSKFMVIKWYILAENIEIKESEKKNDEDEVSLI